MDGIVSIVLVIGVYSTKQVMGQLSLVRTVTRSGEFTFQGTIEKTVSEAQADLLLKVEKKDSERLMVLCCSHAYI